MMGKGIAQNPGALHLNGHHDFMMYMHAALLFWAGSMQQTHDGLT